MQRIYAWSGSIRRAAAQVALVVLVLSASVIHFLLHSPAPGGKLFQAERYALTEHALLAAHLVSLVPEDATVVAQNEYLAHLSRRQRIYEIPVIPDYRQADFLVADVGAPWYKVHKASWERFAASGYFEIVTDRQYGIAIARRKPMEQLLHLRFSNQLTLVGYTLVPSSTIRGGTDLRPMLAWRAENSITKRYVISLQVVDGAGHIWSQEHREPLDGISPTDGWRTGTIMTDQHKLYLPPTTPSGDYEVLVSVHERNNSDSPPVFNTRRQQLGEEVVLTKIRVEKNKASFTAQDLWWIEAPLHVDMGDLRLLGLVPPRATITAGELLQVGLYWRARAKPRGDYLVAVQLREPSGRITFEHEARPAKDTYPTREWSEGEVLLDWHDFILPSTIAAGEYAIHAVLRDAATGRNLGEGRISTLHVVR